MTKRENPFWDWSTALYARDGIAAVCLEAQDRYGLDINIVLLCCWLGARGTTLAPEETGSLVELADDWSQPVIEPLRSIRRHLKPLSSDSSIAALRADVARLELEAERLQQDRLFDAAPGAGQPEFPTDIGAAAANLKSYLASTGVEMRQGLCVGLVKLLAAAFPDTEEADIVPLLANPAPAKD